MHIKMSEIQVVPGPRRYVKCHRCGYEWYSDSQAQKRFCCSKCRTSITVTPLVSIVKEEEVKIPKGVTVQEESEIIMQLEPEKRIRYFIQLAKEAKAKGQKRQRALLITAGP